MFVIVGYANRRKAYGTRLKTHGARNLKFQMVNDELRNSVYFK
ncbi:hypothetical protein D1BOALGB6SA_2547 [Olavius sp. associated proteobacterium Delta 1]|nr:hypothetical protein D1BOALGB6SA_2547 [Olavius sp. associated proteobacterium Delta 1]